jgi:SulP family sulfate permease
VGALSLAAFLGLRSAIAWVPISVLAGILLVVSFKMFDWHAFALLKHRETRLDFAVMAAVVVVAQTVGLIEAALVGVALAILLFIRDQVLGSAILRAHDLRSVGSQRRRLAAARKLLDEHGQAGQLVELQGNLFFGTTDRLYSDLADTLAFRRYLLFDLRRVQSLDYTAAHLFQQMHARLQEQGGRILLSGMPSNAPTHRDIERYLAKLGLVHSGEGIPIFESRNDALEWMEDRVLGEAGWKEPEDDRPLELSEIELFRELGPEDIAALAKIAEPVHLAAGAKLFSRGDPGDELHLIRRGVVDVQLPLPGGKRHHLATIGRGDYLGEMAFLDKGTRSADAQARGEADLFSVHRARFNEFAREHPSVASKIFARLALLVSLRLRSADAELRVLEER